MSKEEYDKLRNKMDQYRSWQTPDGQRIYLIRVESPDGEYRWVPSLDPYTVRKP